MVRITALTIYQDRSLCPTCLKEAQIADKKKHNQEIAEHEHQAHERRSLYAWIAVFVIVILLVVVVRFHMY